ncbi:MAG: DUF4190 domain-containing protein [Lachnospiraceae bacterium]|nr:DUF4190 domain-containing protein [Lachnospiraceae bacterium]
MNEDDLFYSEKTPDPKPAQPSPNPYTQGNPQGGSPYNNGGYPGNNGGPYSSQDPYGYNPPPYVPGESNPLAVIALICGLVSFFCCICPGIAPLVGIAGIICALCSKRKQPFRGTAIAGLIFSIIGVVIGIAIIAYLVWFYTSILNNLDNLKLFLESNPEFKDQLKDVLKQYYPDYYKEIFPDGILNSIRMLTAR